MLDWKSVVREKLGPLPLDAEKREEVIEELAQQLESGYQDEVVKGAGRLEAVRRSLAQFHDWQKLQSDIFQSVKGTQLPVWQQNGIFAPRKPLVWITLALSLGFLLVPSFRKALHILPYFARRDAWHERAFSEKSIQRIEQNEGQLKYAQALAYVALHSPDYRRAESSAEKAITIDPQLTWIAARLAYACDRQANYCDPKPWIQRLQSWDPQNGYVHEMEAELAVHKEWMARWSSIPGRNGELRKALAAEPHWRIPMEKAFESPRMDSYASREFTLDRDVLIDRGQDYPDTLIFASASTIVPDLVLLKQYSDYLLFDVGQGQEKAGHADDALSTYLSVASFAAKLVGDPRSLEQMYSVEIRKQAYSKIAELLHRQGRNLEAAQADLALTATLAKNPKPAFIYGPYSPAFRAAQAISVSGLLVLLFSAIAAAWLICVAVLWAQPNFSQDINRLASRLGWSPLLLGISCLALCVGFLPYSASIARYSSREDLMSTFQPLWFGFWSLQPGYLTNIWIDHMFWPLIWCAAILLLGAILLRWFSRPRTVLPD